MTGVEPSALSLNLPDVVRTQEFLENNTRLDTNMCFNETYKENVADSIAETFLSSNIRTMAGISPSVKNSMAKMEVAEVACHVFAQGVPEQGRNHKHVALSTTTIEGYKGRIVDQLNTANGIITL